MDPEGKVALVTGGASGIGLACVEELLSNGVQVAICDIDTQIGEAAIDKTFGEKKCIFIETDVRAPNAFEAAFKKTIDTFKGLDIVINNAGIGEFGDWEKAIAINTTGVVRGTKLALEHMNKNGSGRGGVVVNVASILGLEAFAGCPVYVATKHAVVGLSRAYGMPLHYDRSGVRVVAICPGVTDTPLLARARALASENIEIADRLKMFDKESQQEAAAVGRGVLHLIRHASNGSVWVCEGGEPVYEVHFPGRKGMRVAA